MCAFAVGSYSVVATGILPKPKKAGKDKEKEKEKEKEEKEKGRDEPEEKHKGLKVTENFIFPAPNSFRISVIET